MSEHKPALVVFFMTSSKLLSFFNIEGPKYIQHICHIDIKSDVICRQVTVKSYVLLQQVRMDVSRHCSPAVLPYVQPLADL